jgi:hypothetical protein
MEFLLPIASYLLPFLHLPDFLDHVPSSAPEMALLTLESVLTYSGCSGRSPGKSPLPVERNYPILSAKDY